MTVYDPCNPSDPHGPDCQWVPNARFSPVPLPDTFRVAPPLKGLLTVMPNPDECPRIVVPDGSGVVFAGGQTVPEPGLLVTTDGHVSGYLAQRPVSMSGPPIRPGSWADLLDRKVIPPTPPPGLLIIDDPPPRQSRWTRADLPQRLLDALDIDDPDDTYEGVTVYSHFEGQVTDSDHVLWYADGYATTIDYGLTGEALRHVLGGYRHVIQLAQIRVDFDRRSDGVGSILLDRVCAHADHRGLPLVLAVVPDDDSPLTYTQTVAWYTGRGFTWLPDPYRLMIREPQP